MNKIYLRNLSFIIIMTLGLSLTGPFASIGFAVENNTSESVQIDSERFLDSELNAELKKQIVKDKSNTVLWTVDLTSVSPKMDGLELKIITTPKISIDKVLVNGSSISLEDSGLFVLEPKNSRVEFTTENNLEVVIEVFKVNGSDKVLVGNLKSRIQSEPDVTLDSTSGDDSPILSSGEDIKSDTSVSNESNSSIDETNDVSKSSGTEETSYEDGIESTLDTKEELESTDSKTHESLESERKASDSTLNSSQEKTIKPKLSKLTPRSAAALAGITGNPEVPKGAILIEGIFGSVNSAGTKGSSGITTIHDPNVNNGMPYSEITLAGSKNWLSIWSNDQYRMDFSTSFHGRTYMNFGSGADADGLAFVMQNDGPTALTTANGAEDGQNLGVYGSGHTNLFGGDWPNDRAVKKSVAIEFDFHLNNKDPYMFDADIQEIPHMAYTFPANISKGYRSTSWRGPDDWSSEDRAVVKHNQPRVLNGVVGDNVRDNTWYEFRYDFDKSSHTFSYYLKNPITGSQTTPTIIPWEDLISELGLTDSNTKAYWGFTGSNGAASGKVKFAFTQVPVDLSAKISNDVLVSEQSIVDSEDHGEYTPALPSATDRDYLTFSTQFTVAEGEAALKIVNWKSNVSPTEFNLDQEPKKVKALIGSKEYSGLATVNEETGEISVTFENLEVRPGEDVVMSYDLEPLKHDSTKKSYFSSRISTEEIGNKTKNDFLSSQVAFWIKGNQKPVLSELLTNKITYTDYSDYFDFSFKYRDLDEDVLSYKLIVNGIELSEKNELNGLVSDQDYNETFNNKIDLLGENTPFKLGDNTLEVVLSDGINEPVTQKVTFNVVGYFGFEEVTDNYVWKYSKTELKDTPTPMARQDKMKMKIRDTRELEKNLVRISFEAESDNESLLQNQFVFVDQGREVESLQIPVNEEKTYDKNQGLLLKLDNSTKSGVVNGTVRWTIIEAP
jgi:hypothetical protein